MDSYGAAMPFDDRVGDGQSQSAPALLCSEVWIKNQPEVFLRDPDSLIGKIDPHVFPFLQVRDVISVDIFILGTDDEGSSLGHSMGGIDGQIVDYLQHLVFIDLNEPETIRKREITR
ncbi:MAG: hypothetical protein P8Y63_16200 [Deltaproteobacteria bacterium]